MLAPKTFPAAAADSKAYQPRRIAVLDVHRAQAAHQSYVTRRVPTAVIAAMFTDPSVPESGDLLLVRVREVGRIDSIELANAKMARLNVGDELVVCHAATATPPAAGEGARVFQLASSAGVVVAHSGRRYSAGQVTEVEFIGALADNRGKHLNIADWGLSSGLGVYVTQPVIACIGETTLPGEPSRAADMVRGLARSGFKVGAANLTGAPGCWKNRMLKNAGAMTVLDLADVGLVNFAGADTATLERAFVAMTGYLANTGVEVIVLELEQRVFGEEVAGIISSPTFHDRISTIILEGGQGLESEIERDSLRALGYDVTLVDGPETRRQYHRMV